MATAETGSRRDAHKPLTPRDGTSPSRWRTPEFLFYFVFILLFALPLMFKAAYDVSKGRRLYGNPRLSFTR